MIRRVLPSFLAILALAVNPPRAAAESAISPPVGFVKIEVAGEAQRPASSPFHALEAAPAWPAPLRALAWDAASGAYRDRVDAPAVGEGVWLVNPAATAVTVYAAGEVPLDDAIGVPLVPGLNLIAYPYLSAPAAESLTLDPAALTDAAGAPVAVLIPGDAYWYRHDGPTPHLWLATRPHANPFTTHAQAPQIVRLEVIEDGQAVRLTLHAPSATPIALSVYYQDLQPATPFDPLDGWQLAAQGLIPAPGGGATHWEDRGATHRAPPAEVLGRLYLVALNGANPNHAPAISQGLERSQGAEGTRTAEDPAEFHTPAAQTKSSASTRDDEEIPGVSMLYVSPRGSNIFPFATWETAATTPQAAIDAAAPGDIVWLAAGDYPITEPLRIDRSIVLRGAPPSASVIRAVATNRCVEINAQGVVLENLTLTGGVAAEGAGVRAAGGILREIIVRDNDASGGSGGGILATGSLRLEYCTIADNRADVGGGLAARADLVLISCVVTGNIARVDGGGMSGGHTVTIVDSVLADNRAGRDGGAFAGAHHTRATLRRTGVTANRAETGDGGGLLVRGRGQCDLIDSHLTDNQSAGRGGALCAWGRATLSGTVMEGNQATQGADRFDARPAAAGGEATP